MDSTATLVFVAGIENSGPTHWQAIWHDRVPNGVWVEHESWDNPVRDLWVKDLDDALRAIDGPKIIVAHSLGCTVVAEWASEHQDDTVVGAFLAALPDVHGDNFPTQALGFGSPRLAPLPFRTVVLASEDDPYGSLESATAGAGHLGARLVNVGPKGHINADSGLGDWPEGWAVLDDEFTG
ncbi:RBBP9/YdeN family alpha/beta hydrolase [Kitasatospora sp. NPDC057223]|uniref:RBBP9/YdeN family alpha/beta hydrolase n=1 Tax=Kitasatospora sp. NPDC057223 TaxID=3346055 RepID=UPI0036279FE3